MSNSGIDLLTQPVCHLLRGAEDGVLLHIKTATVVAVQKPLEIGAGPRPIVIDSDIEQPPCY